MLPAAALAVLCGSCDKLNAAKHRTDTPAREEVPDRNKRGDNYVKPDTTVYVSAVVFNDGYDWRADTLYQRATGCVVLFRNGEEILSIEAGAGRKVSLDPDLHHLMDGHLYTEYSGSENTTVTRDGKELFTYPGREFLCGLLVEGRDVFTLGASRSGKGFSLRKNGMEMMSGRDGVVLGRLSETPSFPTGALYRDGGSLCFCYRRPSEAAGGMDECVMVIDGQESSFGLPDAASYDIRIVDGKPDIKPKNTMPDRRYNYSDGSYVAQVVSYADGTFSANGPRERFPHKMYDRYYFFSAANAFLLGSVLYVAVTPVQQGKAPFLWVNAEGFTYDINGFLTGVEASVGPGHGS